MMDIFLRNSLTWAPTFSGTSKSDPFIPHPWSAWRFIYFHFKMHVYLICPLHLTINWINLCTLHCNYQDAEWQSQHDIHLPRKECLFCPGRQHSLLMLNQAL